MADPAFRMDGPHSPDSVREAANLVAEGIRYLNHATRRGEDGLCYVSDVYDLVGWLNVMAQRMPQLLAQLVAFLDAKRADPWLTDSRTSVRTTARDAAGEGIGHLTVAEGHLRALVAELGAAQNAISGLYVKED